MVGKVLTESEGAVRGRGQSGRRRPSAHVGEQGDRACETARVNKKYTGILNITSITEPGLFDAYGSPTVST